MNRIPGKFILFLLFALFSTGTVLAQDAVKSSRKLNEQKNDVNVVLDEHAANFLVQAADGRMMGRLEGQLAQKNGTTPAIKKYGTLMLHDQTVMLKSLQKLAAAKNVSLPHQISEKKASGRDELAAKTGSDFDKKFISMMEIDHKRDIKAFDQATGSDDPDVSAFAKKYLPMIQGHLAQLQQIDQSYK